MEKEGAKRVKIKDLDDKRQITAVFGATITGEFLPVQLVYQGKSTHCHPKVKFPEDWYISHLENHCSDKTTYISKIIVPFVKNKRKVLKKLMTSLLLQYLMSLRDK